jgi:hypothetical protein
MLKFDLVKKNLNVKSCVFNGAISKLLVSLWGGGEVVGWGHYSKKVENT